MSDDTLSWALFFGLLGIIGWLLSPSPERRDVNGNPVCCPAHDEWFPETCLCVCCVEGRPR